MNFQEAERAYHDLRTQYSAGKLSNSDFETEVSKLKVQDAEGRWWQIGVQSGDWYVHDGQKWSKSRPPLQVPAATPAAPPEAPAAGTAAAATAATAAAPKTPPAKSRGVTPRLFSAAPAGRGVSALPPPAMIGIIALVAIIGIGIIIAAFLFLSGQFRGTTTASATRTPTTAAAAVIPTVVLPTIPPAATNTPVVIPTLAVVAPVPTTAVTVTAPLTTTAAITRSAASGPTATRRPAPTTAPVTTTVPTATKTPNVAPGVYVTKLQTDPGVVNPNDAVGFRVTLLNTTGSGQTYRWLVKVFQCSQNPCVADDFRRSIGESTVVTSNIPTGTSDVIAPKHWSAGVGACTYVAMPHYLDPSTQQPTPFLQTNGQPMYALFSLCH